MPETVLGPILTAQPWKTRAWVDFCAHSTAVPAQKEKNQPCPPSILATSVGTRFFFQPSDQRHSITCRTQSSSFVQQMMLGSQSLPDRSRRASGYRDCYSLHQWGLWGDSHPLVFISSTSLRHCPVGRYPEAPVSAMRTIRHTGRRYGQYE